ncbi:tyrosine-type recombinase/integrase [Petroclostridium sp. X23]|uniref:tyrosine-type recombinase/integrase n=1 Tax=Petroclostridium sp. X23 TaxID=3045146 RepID=UPI0024AD2E19|nr:tyrosine-type recombinase/integrase [Petroclostridium sp. X23]WHH57723.1 tyrosine-type recombinase/integrase [Petroclostridium sp. X23]
MKKNDIDSSQFFWNTAMDYIRHYLTDIRKASGNTISAYRNALNHYIDYLEKQKQYNRKDITFKEFNRKNVKEYMNWMLNDQQLAPKTCNLRLTAVHALMEYASQENFELMEKTKKHLKCYLNEFHDDNKPDAPLFYATTHGEKHHLSTDTVEKMLKRYAAKCISNGTKMPSSVHCHMIRKTRAMNLYQQGIPLTHIQQLLGHENISTTSGFYAFATLDTLAKSLEKANESQTAKKWKDKKVMEKLYRL